MGVTDLTCSVQFSSVEWVTLVYSGLLLVSLFFASLAQRLGMWASHNLATGLRTLYFIY